MRWFDQIPEKAQDKCRIKIERLQELGHELRRPEADYLRDGIYELRVRLQSVNYRMLYFFHGREVCSPVARNRQRTLGSAECDRIGVGTKTPVRA